MTNDDILRKSLQNCIISQEIVKIEWKTKKFVLTVGTIEIVHFIIATYK